MKIKFFLVIICLLFGCATNPNNMMPVQVSGVEYKDYECEDIQLELDFVTRRENELYNFLKKKADLDALQLGTSLLLFWPMLFALEGGDGQEAAEYRRLKGERQALEDLSIKKGCRNP